MKATNLATMAAPPNNSVLSLAYQSSAPSSFCGGGGDGLLSECISTIRPSQHEQQQQQSKTTPDVATTMNAYADNGVDIKDTDNANAASRLAQEMTELTMSERARVYDDIHSVAHAAGSPYHVEETQELLEECFYNFDKVLKKMPNRRLKRVNRAFFLCPLLKEDRNWKLMFLRAELYNPSLAVERMIRYFDFKCELFGDDKLVEQITISDLSQEDIQSIRGGYQVLLPCTDPSGRPVIFLDNTKYDWTNQSIDSMVCVITLMLFAF